jgi:hypothetical protein
MDRQIPSQATPFGFSEVGTLFVWFMSLDPGVQLALVGVLSTLVAGTLAIWKEQRKGIKTEPINGQVMSTETFQRVAASEGFERLTAALEAMNMEFIAIRAVGDKFIHEARDMNRTHGFYTQNQARIIENQQRSIELQQRIFAAAEGLEREIARISTQMEINRALLQSQGQQGQHINRP